jgi:hypothetical protein
MTNVIDLHATHSAEYRKALEELLERLESMADELADETVSLAMVGPWRKWSDEQEVGTIVNVSAESLLESGDPRVVSLVHLVCAIRKAREELKELGLRSSGAR